MKDQKKLQKEQLEEVKGGTDDVIHSRWAMLADKRDFMEGETEDKRYIIRINSEGDA